MKYDLTKMVQRSGLIAVVVPAHPSMYQKEILFEKEWERLPDDLKKLPLSNPDIPPYIQHIYCFVIKSVLLGDQKIGQHIEVVSAHDGISQSAHFDYYALGMNISNDYDRYQPKYKVNEEGEQIVFVRPYYKAEENSNTQDPFDSIKSSPSTNSYQFIAHQGREGLEAKSEIERLIKESKSTDFLEMPEDPFVQSTPKQ